MLKTISVTAICALALAFTVPSQPASARNDFPIVAGVVGGLALGAIAGSQYNGAYYGGPGYYGAPGYYAQSGYDGQYGGCHIERQIVSDRYGRERVRRVRVCD
jgi:hypothetical protein